MRISTPLALALVTLAGCSFPDVTIEDKPGDSSAIDSGGIDAKSDSTKIDAGDDTAVGDDTADDTLVEDVELVDTSPPDIGPETNTCDKDGDGYQPVGGSCDPGTKGADCDDLTAAANPGVTKFIYSKPPKTLTPAGDWNCDGVVDKQYTVVSSCPGLLTGCEARSGVQAVTGCGEPINIVTCVNDGLGCKDTIKAGLQGCK